MRRGERHVPGDRKLARRFDRGCAAAEIKQQIFYGELRVYFLGVEDDEALRYEVAGKREYDVLPAGDRARRQRRKISGARDADIDRRLPRLFPGDARRRVAALGDIDQLDERIDMVGIDVGGRRQLDCRVLRHREPLGRGWGGCRGCRRFFGRLELPRGVGRRGRQVARVVAGAEQRASGQGNASEPSRRHAMHPRPTARSPAAVADQPRREFCGCPGAARRTMSRAP